jgi:hypothetical protein
MNIFEEFLLLSLSFSREGYAANSLSASFQPSTTQNISAHIHCGSDAVLHRRMTQARYSTEVRTLHACEESNVVHWVSQHVPESGEIPHQVRVI